MSPWKRILLVGALEAVGLILAHEILIRVVAERDVVSTILAAGSHIPASTLVLAGTFLLVRFLVLLVLPGIVLSRLALAALEWWEDRRTARIRQSGTMPPSRGP